MRIRVNRIAGPVLHAQIFSGAPWAITPRLGPAAPRDRLRPIPGYGGRSSATPLLGTGSVRVGASRLLGWLARRWLRLDRLGELVGGLIEARLRVRVLVHDALGRSLEDRVKLAREV